MKLQKKIEKILKPYLLLPIWKPITKEDISNSILQLVRKEILRKLTIKEALMWSNKHRMLSDNEGVRVVHIKQLLEKVFNEV